MHLDTKKCHFHSLGIPLPQNVDWSKIFKLSQPTSFEEMKKICYYCTKGIEHSVPQLKEE